MTNCLYCGEKTQNPKFCSTSCYHKYGHTPQEIENLKKSIAANPNYGMKGKHHCSDTIEKIKNHPTRRDKISRALKGKPKSKEHREKLSIAAKNRVHPKLGPMPEARKRKISAIRILSGIAAGKNNPRYGKLPASPKRYKYQSPLQGEITFRSGWELAYAKYLDANHILWMYEMETFDLGDKTYTPDFFLPRQEKFIEIKVWIRPNLINCVWQKINQFREQYPWDLDVLTRKELKELRVI